jgi:hypothetical protein
MLAVSVAAHADLMDVRQLINVQTLRDGRTR